MNELKELLPVGQAGYSPWNPPRTGAVLVIVLIALTLFALVGLSFVFYAQSAARMARDSRDAVAEDREALPETLSAYFLQQLLYDTSDDESGVFSALRGHSLVRLLYGFSDAADKDGTQQAPFCGTGRLHYPHTGGGALDGVDDFSLINYTYCPQDGFLRDPERLGFRQDLSQPRGPYLGGLNPPYTYPDLNHLFLAAVKSDGTLLIPSFHRPWLFGSLDPSNPNWTNQLGKYLLLRPRPAEMGPGFPYPEDLTGDVKNLVAAPGGNDSLWLDLGAPVMQTPSGRKFKVLFAPLIVDLDNRLNLNVHGNVRAMLAGIPTHCSNQGLGPWEVNLGAVIDKLDAAGLPEWSRLFRGTSQPFRYGRYGASKLPNATHRTVPPFSLSHSYAMLDFDGVDETTGGPSGRIQYGSQASVWFPIFPTTGYGNGSLAERLDHPMLYDPSAPPPSDAKDASRSFAAWSMEPLLRPELRERDGGVSEPLLLCPQSFADPRICRLVTTHSADLAKPGVAPWIYDPRAAPYLVTPDKWDQAPRGAPVPFPDVRKRGEPLPPGSDFSPGWRATAALQGKIELNRSLPAFPHQGSGTSAAPGPPLVGPHDRFDTNNAESQYIDALLERQRLADNLYRLMLALTGVAPPLNPISPSDEELRPRRWLAQLAANIVDFIDEDEIMTPFNFYTEHDAYPNGRPANAPPFDIGLMTAGTPEMPRYWVFGTELPRVVLNEVLAEANLPAKPKDGDKSQVSVWIELFNPLQPPISTTNVQPIDSLPVPLYCPELSGQQSSSASGSAKGYAPYRVEIASQLRSGAPNNDNVLGRASVKFAMTGDSDFESARRMDGGKLTPAPGAGSIFVDMRGGASGSAFALIGPEEASPDSVVRAVSKGGSVPDNTPYAGSANLQFEITYSAADRTWSGLDDKGTVLLRRLANPHIPFDPQPTIADASGNLFLNAWYNPYVTVDVIPDVIKHQLEDLIATKNAARPSATKLQPYDSSAMASSDPHTLGQMNKATSPINTCLVHLDRPLTSPLELLQVSGCQPHQLTQRFDKGAVNGQRYLYQAPWLDPACRLYRFFEFVETRTRVAGTNPTSKIAGKINLNTIWDPEILLALTDPQPANYFSATDVKAVFTQLLQKRTSGNSPGPSDRPFLGLATGENGVQGLEDTFLRSWDGAGSESSRRLFEPASTPDLPALRHELLTKMFNQVTNRSNVFAIWLTMGYFEVLDDTTRPVKLGAELGKAENRERRHRMFAIVDRTNAALPTGAQATFDVRQDPAVVYFHILD